MTARYFKSFPVNLNEGAIHASALRWGAANFSPLVFLHSNGYRHDKYASLPWAYALGAANTLSGDLDNAFDALKDFSGHYHDWLFGFFSYDLKNQLEDLSSRNPDHIGMPLIHFFRPVILVLPEGCGCRIGCLPGYGQFSDPDFVLQEMLKPSGTDQTVFSLPPLKARVSKEKYLEQVSIIKKHIQAGDIYELNFCMEFYADKTGVDPVQAFLSLNQASPAPFSCFYQVDDNYLLCASPERFMQKLGDRLISQPIKGTSARGLDPGDDLRSMDALRRDPKERSENVMIVDLVRNDLSRTAQIDSVKVEELCGVYTFPQVHQMISTISSRLRPDSHYLDAVRHAFPMGSMTGAPKIRAMQLIEKYEDTRRGLYSGAVGYISPEKDFDFNVVIRSLQYNKKKSYLAYMAGGAITSASDPAKEYAECLLKASALMQLS